MVIAQPPLRAATVWCIELRPGLPVPVQTLAIMAEVDAGRAKAFASILVARGALIETEAGLMPGPGWEAWRNLRGGRPHRSQGDPATMSVMDDMRRALARNVRDLTARQGWSQSELARRSGVPVYAINRLWLRAEPLTAAATVMVARVLGSTVEELVSRPAPFRG